VRGSYLFRPGSGLLYRYPVLLFILSFAGHWPETKKIHASSLSAFTLCKYTERSLTLCKGRVTSDSPSIGNGSRNINNIQAGNPPRSGPSVSRTACDAFEWDYSSFLDLVGSNSGAMWGTTPPWEMITVEEGRVSNGERIEEGNVHTVTKELIQFLIVANGELKMARDDAV
jgi:hypothetical protein